MICCLNVRRIKFCMHFSSLLTDLRLLVRKSKFKFFMYVLPYNSLGLQVLAINIGNMINTKKHCTIYYNNSLKHFANYYSI